MYDIKEVRDCLIPLGGLGNWSLYVNKVSNNTLVSRIDPGQPVTPNMNLILKSQTVMTFCEG
jgi:hypothetical protein